jgi:hypothetical protein
VILILIKNQLLRMTYFILQHTILHLFCLLQISLSLHNIIKVTGLHHSIAHYHLLELQCGSFFIERGEWRTRLPSVSLFWIKSTTTLAAFKFRIWSFGVLLTVSNNLLKIGGNGKVCAGGSRIRNCANLILGKGLRSWNWKSLLFHIIIIKHNLFIS